MKLLAAALLTATAACATILSNANADGTTIEILAVHLIARRLSNLRRLEGDEAEAARLSSLAVLNDLGIGDRTEALES